MKRRYLNLILILLSFSSVLAQNVKVDVGPVEGSAYKIIQTDNDVYHAIKGAKCTFSIEGQISDVLWHGPRIKKDGFLYDPTYWNNKHSGTLLLDIQDEGTYELFVDSVTYTLDGEDQIVRYGESAVINFQIELYDEPKLSSDVFTTENEVIWNTTSKNFKVETEGGYESGWNYLWKLDGTESKGSTWEGSLQASNEYKKLQLVIKNISPDGSTIWYEDSTSCSFLVYEYPQEDDIKLNYRGRPCPETMDWYCDDSSTDKIEVSVPDYKEDDWSCEWIGNNVKRSNEKSFRPSMFYFYINSFDQGEKYSYSVKIKFQPNGMDPSLACSHDIKGTVNFWKTPEITPLYDDYKVVFDNAEVFLKLDVKGGIPGDSSEVFLSLDDDSVEVTKSPDGKYKFKVLEVDNRSENKRYKLAMQFSNENTSIKSTDKDIDLTIWKTPIITPKYKSNNPVCNEEYDVNSTIFVCEKFGGEVDFLVDTKYGDERSWTYSWINSHAAGDILSTEANLSVPIDLHEANTQRRDEKYSLVVINEPLGMKEELLFRDTIDFDLAICPTPSFDLEKIKSYYAGMHGEDLTFPIDNAIGEGGEWRYLWQKLGEDKTTEASALKLENNGTELIQENWLAKPSYYGPLGDIWFGEDTEDAKSFSVNIYPSPQDENLNFIGFRQDRIDAFYEGEKTYPVGFEGEYAYATNWTYRLSYDDEIRIDSSIKHVNLVVNELIQPQPFDENQGYVKNNVELLVECQVYDADADVTLTAYKQKDSLDYYAWRKGEAKSTMDKYPDYVYYDEEIQLGVNPKFGYTGDLGSDEDGWQYEWKLNDSIISEDKATHKHECKNTDKKREIIYSLRCVNRLNGEESYNSTFIFKFDEYAKIKEASWVDVYPTNVREGDEMILSVTPPQNGNPEGWKYYWEHESKESAHNLTNDTIPARVVHFVLSDSGDKKSEKSMPIALYYYNEGTDGRNLGEYKLPFDFNIHRKPRVESLKKKGDGTSSIYIAQSPSKEVSFEFGQGELPKGNVPSDNAVGIRDKEDAQGEYMVYRYETSPTTPWVRTFWDYTDGFRCYSDPFEPTVRMQAPSRELTIEDGYFSVNMEEAVPAIVTLYTINGELVKEQHYAPRQEYVERLDFDGLSAGMYILKCIVGDMQVVKKLMIR